MKKVDTFTNYLVTTSLVGLFAALGIAAAITVVVALWTPMVATAGKLF